MSEDFRLRNDLIDAFSEERGKLGSAWLRVSHGREPHLLTAVYTPVLSWMFYVFTDITFIARRRRLMTEAALKMA